MLPISPSGRYAAVLKLPFQDRVPAHTDGADVCVVDLQEQSIAVVETTYAWGTQVGAHITWGKDDTELFYDVKDGANVFAVSYNILTGERREFAGGVYQATRDGRYLFSPNLALINYSQEGYGGTVDPALNCIPADGVSVTEGLWRTDTHTGEKKLILSIKDAFDVVPDKRLFTDGKFVFFHTKINPQADRIMQVVRFCRNKTTGDVHKDQLRYIVTCDFDGGNVKLALPYEMWLKGSHHPDWHPDGRRILMNIGLVDIRFCLFSQAFENFTIVAPQRLGGGHPSFDATGRYVVTDAYTHEKEMIDENYRVPIRLIDTTDGSETHICRVWTLGGSGMANENRCDPHPVWDNVRKQLVFNGAPEGKKLVMVADMRTLLA